jgi:parallel beta-helix repeat protein
MSALRGIGFRHYATSIPQLGAVRVEGRGDLVENVVASGNATTGITVDTANVTIRDVTVTGSGLLGLHANYADGLSLVGVLATDNNTEHFNQSPVSGGTKITRTRGIVVNDSVFQGNLGYGLWLDESCYNMTVVGNTMSDNTAHGLSLEISASGTVADNVISGNDEDGIKINNTSDLEVWNNSLLGNQRQVEIVEDQRRGARLSDAGHDPRQILPDATEPWIIRNVDFQDNLIDAPAAGNYEINMRDYSGQYAASDLNITVDGNNFVRVSSGAEIVWQLSPATVAVYPSVAQFMAATGQGAHNTERIAGGPVNDAAANPLSASIAALIGQATGTRHVGAFS